MDARVKPAHDESRVRYGPGSAERHKNAAPRPGNERPFPGRDAARRASRRDASQNRDRTKRGGWYGPASAERHKNAAPRPGHTRQLTENFNSLIASKSCTPPPT